MTLNYTQLNNTKKTHAPVIEKQQQQSGRYKNIPTFSTGLLKIHWDWKIEYMDMFVNNCHICFHTLFVYSVNSISFMVLLYRHFPF